MEKGKRIYLDHAATTPTDTRVKSAMKPYWDKDFGNPGAIYKEGVIAKTTIQDARKSIAESIGAQSDEIIFTSGGTEANNLAILGFAAQLRKKRGNLSSVHFITSVIEHPSVLACFKELQKEGAEVSYVGVTPEGVFDLEVFKKVLSSQTALVSVMWVNNEIGTLQPIAEISKILRSFRKSQMPKATLPLLHSDASQVPLFQKVDVEKAGVDLLVIDGQKIYGPKGVGALYKKKNVTISPLIYGGKQEFHLRPGTENVPAIVGFAKALEIAGEEREKDTARLSLLRDYFIDEVLRKVPGAQLNGGRYKRLPNNVNISFQGIDNEWLVLELDARGIAVSTRSACIAGDSGASYVISALRNGTDRARGNIRFTFGRSTTKKQLVYVIKTITQILTK